METKAGKVMVAEVEGRGEKKRRKKAKRKKPKKKMIMEVKKVAEK